MKQLQKEKITDVVSLISRSAALIFAMAIIFSAGYIFELQEQNINKTYKQIDVSASFIGKTFMDKVARKIEKGIIERDAFVLKKILKIPNDSQFLSELQSWKEIRELKIEALPNGIFIYLLANTTGDSLHPYSGYVHFNKNQFPILAWGENASAFLEKSDVLKKEGYVTLLLVNMGPYPWKETDEWKNITTNDNVIILSERGTAVIEPGEKAFFVSKTAKSYVLQNSTRAFLVALEN